MAKHSGGTILAVAAAMTAATTAIAAAGYLALDGNGQFAAVQTGNTCRTGGQGPGKCPKPTKHPKPTPPPATPDPNCTILVPANPLSAQGLATPYRLVATDPAQGPCHESDANQSAFVQATVLDPATGRLSVYNPLVIDKGTRPLRQPVVPKLPNGAVVGIWFGFNGTTLTLKGTGARECVNGPKGSPFGQFAYCHAPAFFSAAEAAVKKGALKVPKLGTAKDGKPCPTTRSFELIDQDQSDNVTTRYLADAKGRLAQDTKASRAKLPGATTVANGSDNLLLTGFVDQALGCAPFTAPDLADPGATTTSLALDELQAAKQGAPVALVPTNDPMTLLGTALNVSKTNLYRAGVGQPTVTAAQTPAAYCKSMDSMQAAFLQRDRKLLAAAPSPIPAMATNLFTFMGMRLQQSFTNLNCQHERLTNPVAKLVTNGAGVVTGVVFRH